jgi:hypothetical protein
LRVTTPSKPEGELRSIRPRADYLALPLLFKVRFDAGVVSPYVIGGPRFDFLLSAEGDVISFVYDDLKNIDAGASFGLGVEVPMDLGRHVLVEFRLSPTFTEAFRSDMVTVRNRSMEFLAGICF